jgi:tetratricopeptide (TPR) repeat protein
MMSLDGEEAVADNDSMVCCASCGKAEVDDVKLKICTACKLVRYCSADCQKNDDRLFSQPDESYLGECPICCLQLPIDENKWRINSCCCQCICIGCQHANKEREIEQGLEHKCPYCREPLPKTEEEIDQNYMKRVKANDPVALLLVGFKYFDDGDFKGAVEYFAKAAALGDIEAHYNLAVMYDKGRGVEKDPKREMYHLEEAAIGGHPGARFNLGINEGRNGEWDRAAKHLIIAAKLGHHGALKMVKENFRRGFLSKEDYEAALRGHQAAVDATKSAQRDAAEEFMKRGNQI